MYNILLNRLHVSYAFHLSMFNILQDQIIILIGYNLIKNENNILKMDILNYDTWFEILLHAPVMYEHGATTKQILVDNDVINLTDRSQASYRCCPISLVNKTAYKIYSSDVFWKRKISLLGVDDVLIDTPQNIEDWMITNQHLIRYNDEALSVMHYVSYRAEYYKDIYKLRLLCEIIHHMLPTLTSQTWMYGRTHNIIKHSYIDIMNIININTFYNNTSYRYEPIDINLYNRIYGKIRRALVFTLMYMGVNWIKLDLAKLQNIYDYCDYHANDDDSHTI